MVLQLTEVLSCGELGLPFISGAPLKHNLDLQSANNKSSSTLCFGMALDPGIRLGTDLNAAAGYIQRPATVAQTLKPTNGCDLECYVRCKAQSSAYFKGLHDSPNHPPIMGIDRPLLNQDVLYTSDWLERLLGDL